MQGFTGLCRIAGFTGLCRIAGFTEVLKYPLTGTVTRILSIFRSKKLKKILIFFEKVLTIGIRHDIMSVATTKQLNTKTAPARRVAKSDHRQGIRVTRARIKQCAKKAETDN